MVWGLTCCKRWTYFPVQPSISRQLQRPPSSSPLRVKEALFEFGRSANHLALGNGELLCRDTLKAYTYTYDATQTVESTSISEDNVKVSNSTDYYNRTDYSSKSIGATKYSPAYIVKDSSAYVASLKSSSHLQFGLLMENIDKIDDILSGEDLVRLDGEIMVHIGKLGALNLFHACLSRTIMAPSAVSPNFLLTEHFRDLPIEISQPKTKKIVRTRKKDQRKIRRLEASLKNSKSNKDSKSCPLSDLSRPRSKSKRYLIAQNESEMSKGIKVVVDLERTRLKLEEEISHSASYTRWAEAAGIDEKTLQQRLQFGWYCRDKLIKSTHSLVVYLARNYRGMGIAFDDLLQAGNIGVLKGAERFDDTRGYRFSTYVRYWIRKEILALLARHSKGIKLPVTMEKYIKRIHKAGRAFYDEEGRYPLDDEMAKLTGLSLANVRLARKCSRVGVSLDKEMVDGWHTTFMEVTEDTTLQTPEQIITRQHMRKDVLEVLERLCPRERRVMVLRFGLEDGRCKSLAEIAECCQVTKEWIRKIEKAGFMKIRTDEVRRGLKCYLNL